MNQFDYEIPYPVANVWSAACQTLTTLYPTALIGSLPEVLRLSLVYFQGGNPRTVIIHFAAATQTSTRIAVTIVAPPRFGRSSDDQETANGIGNGIIERLNGTAPAS